jgi:hypothetical protein
LNGYILKAETFPGGQDDGNPIDAIAISFADKGVPKAMTVSGNCF